MSWGRCRPPKVVIASYWWTALQSGQKHTPFQITELTQSSKCMSMSLCADLVLRCNCIAIWVPTSNQQHSARCATSCILIKRTLRPQANGNAERFNRTLQNMLTSYCEQEQNRWDEYVPQVLIAYRASINSATHQTPTKMVLGRNVVLPLEAVIGKLQQTGSTDEQCKADEYISQLQNRLVRAHEIARKHLKVNADYQNRHYDLGAKKRSLHQGQAVWLSVPHRKVGACTKLTSKWKGPFLVLKKIDDISYLVKKSEKQRSAVYHIDRLEPYRGGKIPSWFQKEISKLQ